MGTSIWLDHPWLEEGDMTEAAPPVPREDLTLAPIEHTEPSDSLPRGFDPTPDQRQLDAWKEEAESRIEASIINPPKTPSAKWTLRA